MEDDLGGESLGKLTMMIGADMNPYMAALGAMGSKSLGPVSAAMQTMKGFMSDGVANIGDFVGALMSRKFGEAFEKSGMFLSDMIGSSIHKALSFIPFGDFFGGMIEAGLHKASSVIIGSMGKVLSAATGPITEMLSAPLTDLDRWVAKALETEKGIAHLRATIVATGREGAFTVEGIAKWAEKLASESEHSKGEIMKSVDAMLLADRVRGPQVGRAVEAAGMLADIKGGSIEEMAHLLSRALNEPEHGIQRLKRQFHEIFDEDAIRAIKGSATELEAQNKILDIINTKGKAFAETMGGTTEANLRRLKNAWEGIGKDIGQAILPITTFLTRIATGVVTTFGGPVREILKDLKGMVTDAMGTANAWVNRNMETFTLWKNLIREIIVGGWKELKRVAGDFLGALNLGNANDFWERMKGGVTDILTKLAALSGSWDLIKEAGAYAIQFIQTKWADLIDWVSATSTWGNFTTMMYEMFKRVADFLMKAMDKAIDYIAAGFQRAMSQQTAQFVQSLVTAVPGLAAAIGVVGNPAIIFGQLGQQGVNAQKQAKAAFDALGLEKENNQEDALQKQFERQVRGLELEKAGEGLAAGFERRMDEVLAKAKNREMGPFARGEEEKLGRGDRAAADRALGAVRKEAFANMHDSIQHALKGDVAVEQRNNIINQLKMNGKDQERGLDLVGKGVAKVAVNVDKLAIEVKKLNLGFK